MVKIFIERENKEINIDIEKKFKKKEIVISKLLEDLKISKNSIIIIKNNEIALEEEKINNKDSIKLLSVVSGG